MSIKWFLSMSLSFTLAGCSATPSYVVAHKHPVDDPPPMTAPAWTHPPRYMVEAFTDVTRIWDLQTGEHLMERAAIRPLRDTSLHTRNVLKDQINRLVLFAVGSDTLQPQARRQLDQLGQILSDDRMKQVTLIIAGHADASGSHAHNRRLSLKRAQAVARYVTKKAPIEPSRLRVRGHGASFPLSSHANPTNRKLNRRVAIRLARPPMRDF